MHIPDGYLSPASCGALGASMVPAWAIAGRRVRRVVKTRHVALLAVGAAYCFLVMMFNVPIPDGTTAHAVGGVLVAVVLGPEAAIIAVSVALRHPGAVLRRRRHPRLRGELLQHGVRPAGRAATSCTAC